MLCVILKVYTCSESGTSSIFHLPASSLVQFTLTVLIPLIWPLPSSINSYKINMIKYVLKKKNNITTTCIIFTLLYLAHDAKFSRIFAMFNFNFLMTIIHFKNSRELWPWIISASSFGWFRKNFK